MKLLITLIVPTKKQMFFLDSFIESYQHKWKVSYRSMRIGILLQITLRQKILRISLFVEVMMKIVAMYIYEY